MLGVGYGSACTSRRPSKLRNQNAPLGVLVFGMVTSAGQRFDHPGDDAALAAGHHGVPLDIVQRDVAGAVTQPAEAPAR